MASVQEATPQSSCISIAFVSLSSSSFACCLALTPDLAAIMVNPGAFRGARYAFLVEQKPLYAAAVVGGHIADCLADIQRRYFKRFAVDAPHDVDPPADFLENVNDEEADPEPAVPDEDTMSEEEYQVASKKFRLRQMLIATRKDVCACLERSSLSTF